MVAAVSAISRAWRDWAVFRLRQAERYKRMPEIGVYRRIAANDALRLKRSEARLVSTNP